jgi:hypothetical protein
MTEDKILLTARYVEGDLTNDERVAFENLLAHDEQLKQHLADYQDIHSSIQMKLANDAEKVDFTRTLDTLNKQHFGAVQANEPKVKKLKVNWSISAVAAVLVLGLLLWAPWNGSLYEQFAAYPEMSVTERGAEQTELDKAALLFNDRKYEDAKIILASLYSTDKGNSLVSYYYAATLLETEEMAKGRAILAELSLGESVFKYDAAYDVAMSYLKEGKDTDAKFWLSKIPDGAVKYDKAQELLKKL